MTIDEYLARLANFLTVRPEIREQILQEVRDHLEDASHQLSLTSMPGPQAEARVVAAFGSAAQVARRFNAVHPLYWDRRRFAVGLLGGLVATWAVWTLLCYPLLVQAAMQRPVPEPPDPSTPWSLLLSATPLGFGMPALVIVYRYWFGALFLVLYCLTPFLWGRRAQGGWQPGLAFGLGAVLGFIWLPRAILAQWPQTQTAAVFVFVGAIGLLVPVSLLAAWVGRLSLAWLPGAFLPRHARSPIARWTRSRMTPPVAVIVCLVLILVGVSAWSFVRAAQYTTLPPIRQQLQTAQANLSFVLRQPAYLPAGMVLTFVTGSPNQCENACALLYYQGAHGVTMYITEVATTPTPVTGPLPSATHQVSQDSGDTNSGPMWWLGGTAAPWHDIAITWEQDQIVFNVYTITLGTNATLSVEVLEHVADSLQ